MLRIHVFVDSFQALLRINLVVYFTLLSISLTAVKDILEKVDQQE